MAEVKRVLVGTAVPPLVLDPRCAAPRRRADPFPRLGRLIWLAAAFSLPTLGLTFADLVHRAGEQGVTQAASPFSPSNGVAAPTGVTRATRLVRVTPSIAAGREGRA